MKEINLVMQPYGSSLCGQACVATIAGITLEESVEAFGGTKAGTRTKQVVEALRKLGINCGDRLIRIKDGNKPDCCIVKQYFDNCDWTHWVVYYNGCYFDPGIGVYKKYVEGMRETSYLPIYL